MVRTRHVVAAAAGTLAMAALSAPHVAAAPAAAPAPAPAPAAVAKGVPVVTLLTKNVPVRAAKWAPREVGMQFTPKMNGQVRGIRVYKASARATATPARGSLWTATGKRLATKKFPRHAGSGWLKLDFNQPVRVVAGKTYVVSAFAKNGRVSSTRNDFDAAKSNPYLKAPADRNGLVRRSATSRFPRNEAAGNVNFWVDVRFQPASSPAAAGNYPGPGNTGVRASANLRRYTGPCTITKTVTLDQIDATSCDALLIRARDVVITNSKLPRIDATAGGSASVTVKRSTILGGRWSDGALWGYNFTARRVEVTGGQHSVHCASNCTVTDSWLHNQYNPAGQSYHNNAFISNGGSNMVLRRNTLHCTAILNSTDGGCTADLSLFGDFERIRNVTVDGNLFKANSSSISYCAYGGYQPSKSYPVATGIVFTNNVFERGSNNKCGVYGAVTSFQTGAAGNVWSGNVWDDGRTLRP